jgi:deazaflavin-dependent oxidoreductase (nitroreductase family)
MTATLERERDAWLVTRGRRSGREHTVVVWWASGAQGPMYVMAGNGPSTDWARNALAGPATVRIGRHRFAASAREVTEPAEQAEAARLLERRYRSYPADWGKGYILAFTLVEAD